MTKFCPAHCRIELNENVTGLDALSILNVDRAHHSGLERLYNLGTAAWDNLARRCGNDIGCPSDAQPSATQNSAMIVTPTIRRVGDGGVSVISNAAGRKASS